jgi:hypothetical protein
MMKPSLSLLAGLLIVGCTSDPTFELDKDSTATWSPGHVLLERVPADCGVPTPPFEDLDLYVLGLYDVQSTANPGTVVSVTFVPTDLVGHDYALALDPPPDGASEQTGVTAFNTTTSPNGDIRFYYHQGSQSIDPMPLPLADVSVRFDALPRRNGDKLIADTRITFADGGVLAFTASPALPAPMCPQH